ncbi:MAG TPA: YibE/F family protein [Acidimicrobiia bacterium]|nr:YibE/F family protein [Acidimicrobiia bacterium]
MLRALPIIIVAVVGVATALGVLLLRPTGESKPDLSVIGVNATVYEAVTETVDVNPCEGVAPEQALQCATISFRLTQGPDEGQVFPLTFVVAETAPEFVPGDRVVLEYQAGAEPEFRYNYADRQRRPVLLWVALAFAAVVILLGRLRGFAALLGLIATVFVLLQFVIPAILDARPPVLVAVVGASLIAYVALYTAHGFNRMTTVALLGTLLALGLTAMLSWFVVEAARFTGLITDEAFILTIAGIDPAGLILAGIVLGAIGAIDDVTVTQASAVWELHWVRPDLGRVALMRHGLRVGRDHVASTVNTLLLAYAGAAMPLMIFFVLAEQSLGTVLNSEVVAVEAVRTLVGSIGLVASVPITTWLAAAFATEDFARSSHSHGVV